MKKFQTSSDIHSINTRRKGDVHMPNADITGHGEEEYYREINLVSFLQLLEV
jgi:hypothetical protein